MRYEVTIFSLQLYTGYHIACIKGGVHVYMHQQMWIVQLVGVGVDVKLYTVR